MRVTTLCLFSLLSAATAFTQNRPAFTTQTTASALRMSTTEQAQVPIIVKGQNIEVTKAIEDHVTKRIGHTLTKLASGGAVKECDVILSVNKNPKVKNGHRAEVVTNLKGTTIICINESPDMYASIDMAAHALKRKLSKYKERRLDGWHGGDALNDDLMAALEDLSTADDDIPEVEVEDEFVDFDAPKVIKVDSFDLEKPKSLQEAIFALDYVDHDFYVFLSEETGKISVVYKRHLGGVGLVEP